MSRRTTMNYCTELFFLNRLTEIRNMKLLLHTKRHRLSILKKKKEVKQQNAI